MALQALVLALMFSGSKQGVTYLLETRESHD